MTFCGFGIVVVILLFSVIAQSSADLLPIVDPKSNCSGNGHVVAGVCFCDLFYTGRLCQYTDVKESRLTGFDCYDCTVYDCDILVKGSAVKKNVTVCDGTSTIAQKSSDHEHKELPVTVQTNCRDISSLCYKIYDGGCPTGIAYLGTLCFKNDLQNNFGFFMFVMAILALSSTIFEVSIHKLEHHLEHKNQKAVLGIIQTFKSELTLIGLIGLTLYLVGSSEIFEHTIHAFGGTEEIIEAIHFLIFFMVIGYIFTLAFCFIFSKLFLKRTLRRRENIFQLAREAAFKGENYEEVKRELEIQYKMGSCWQKKYYREYSAYRKYFMNTMKGEYSQEELMFFRFDEYYALCVNDLIGKIAGGSWLAWIFFAWNFFAVVYMQGAAAIAARMSLFIIAMVAFLANNGARSAIFSHLKKESQEQKQANLNEVSEIGSPSGNSVKLYPTLIILLNQSLIWMGLTNVFTSFLSLSADIEGVVLYIMLITIAVVVIIYGWSVFRSLPTIAGAIYNGPLINKHFVKEVMKRHSQVDKQVLIDQYRDKNDGELPVIFDAFVDYEDKIVASGCCCCCRKPKTITYVE